MFWHAILKKVVVGKDSFEEIEQKTLFDTAAGKVHVPFEKMPKCKTPAHLFYGVGDVQGRDHSFKADSPPGVVWIGDSSFSDGIYDGFCDCAAICG